MKPKTERLDHRYSSDEARPVPWADAEARLQESEVAWIVTVSPDGAPHATPMVPVTHDGKTYFHTGPGEVKYANLQANSRVLVLAGDTAWDRGLDVAVFGEAAPVTDTALLRLLDALYRERWGGGRWELDIDDSGAISGTHDVTVFEVRPDKAYGHSKGDPFGQTNYRF